ncbi:hypothetical protein [Rhizobium leguminosarum]|uniref:hypothetical protein n=1 Tax=Rhizobium leguminosarum TaxID=384 RepID=UPI0015F8A312|nr:hypothetical protein [Rhizobium leguminosarum]MBA9034340.1 hypothetical protein [Rhizobium leguminosarum]
MSELYNEFGIVEIVGKGDLSDRFLRVRFLDAHLNYLHRNENGYLVFADTLRFRADGKPHPLDVSATNEIGRRAHEDDVRAYLQSLE